MLLPVGLSYNENREKTVSVESVINMQPEVTYGGRQQVALITTPDLAQFSDTNAVTTEGRGAISVNDALYAVVGNELFKFNDSGTATSLGVVDGSGICGMSASSTEIHISVFDTGYVFNIGTEVLTQITDVDYPQGYTTAYLNGRFITEDPTPGTTGRFYYSDVLDGTAWQALNFATAERKTDDALAVYAFGEALLIFGTRSIEFWSGDASGFVPVPGAVLPYGLAARNSPAEAGGLLFFLDSDGQVRMLQGYGGQVVSTPAVAEALNSDSSAEGCAYVKESKVIYEISTSSLTLCYDATTSAQTGKPIWFKKETNDGRFRGRKAVYAHNKTLQLGYDTNKVYELSRTAVPDKREFTIMLPVDDDSRRWTILDKIELIGRAGTGAIPSDNPQIMLKLSRDNGYTFDEEKWVGVGTVGDYGKRIKWRRLGRFLQLSMRFRQTDDVDWTVLGVSASGR